MPIFGFSRFDKSAQANGATGPLTAGPLTPAFLNEWAIIAAANTSGGTGVAVPGFTSIFSDQVQIGVMPLMGLTPVSISDSSVALEWCSNLVLFGGTSYPLVANTTNITVASNVLTVVCTQTFVVGTRVSFLGTNLGNLNGHTVTILTNNGSSFTAAFTNANYGPAADSGTATNLPYLQIAAVDGPGSFPASLTFPNSVQAGSTILVGVLSSDSNAKWTVTTVTDGTNPYTITNAPGTGTGFTPDGYVNLAWSVNVAGGATTVVMNGTTTTGTGSMRYVIFELPQGLFLFNISGNAGIAGATLTLSGDASGTTTADGSGNYSFGNLPNGNYIVTPSLGAFAFTPANRNVTISNASVSGVNFAVGEEVAVAQVQIEITYQNPGNFLYARDIDSWGDGGTYGQNNGVPYTDCFVTIGSIELAALGAPGFPLQHICGYFDAVGTLNSGGPSQPDIYILPNEINDTTGTGGVGFLKLPVVEFEPPIGQTQPSSTIQALRYPVDAINSALANQFIHHLQLRIDWEPENARNVIKAISFKSSQQD